MSTLETLIEPLRHSPRLPEMMDLLQLQMAKDKLPLIFSWKMNFDHESLEKHEN